MASRTACLNQTTRSTENIIIILMSAHITPLTASDVTSSKRIFMRIMMFLISRRVFRWRTYLGARHAITGSGIQHPPSALSGADLGKLFTHMSPSNIRAYFGTGASWESNHRSCVTDISGISTYGLTASEREMSTPPTHQCKLSFYLIST